MSNRQMDYLLLKQLLLLDERVSSSMVIGCTYGQYICNPFTIEI